MFTTLSGRFLILTVVFVMLAEVLIFVPSIANFREEWLSDRIATVAVAGLASRGRDSEDAAPLSPDEEAGLLRALDALLVAIIEGDASRLLARDPRLEPESTTMCFRSTPWTPTSSLPLGWLVRR